jgi:hypothetical protein
MADRRLKSLNVINWRWDSIRVSHVVDLAVNGVKIWNLQGAVDLGKNGEPALPLPSPLLVYADHSYTTAQLVCGLATARFSQVDTWL